MSTDRYRYRRSVLALTAVLVSMIVAQARAETLTAERVSEGSVKAAAPLKTDLAVTNVKDGETLRYPVALLLGTLRDRNETTIAIVNRSAKKVTARQWSGIALRGRFKALVELQPGENRLEMSAGNAKLSCVLHYRPQTNPYIVRMVYFTDKSGKTAYQTPVANDAQDFRGKFDAALKLMQCFTAESMNRHGYGRRTFNLELDENGRVITHIVKGDGTEKEYWEMDDGRLYGIAADAIGKQIPHPTAINLAVIAFTSFDPVTKRNRAHTALGGGNLAFFGGSSIYTWPNSIADVQRACMDGTMTDVNQFASDSIGRNSYWANTSTTTGACLHELGHAFGLPHSADYNGIMVRGIDNFTRNFVFIDPPCTANAQPVEFKDDEIGRWEPVSLAAMAPSRYFALDKRPWSERNSIGFEFDAKAGSVTVRSEDGLRFVGIDGPGRADVFVPIDSKTPPRKIVVSLADVGRRVASAEAELRVVDAQGQMRNMPVKDLGKSYDSDAVATLISGNSIRTWHFSKITQPWSGAPAFAAVDAAKLKEIVASALQSPAVTSPDSFIEFAPRFPADKRENVAGYVVRKLTSDKPRKIRLGTGSDDALRIWLNGRLIQTVSAHREAKPDCETCDADLPKGESTLVAEVSQGGGGWGLYLRLRDTNGCELAVAGDGRVVEWPNQDCSGKPLGQSRPSRAK